MSEFAQFFSIYATWVSIPCLAIISIIYWLKQKTNEHLIFMSGVVLIALGSLTQIFSPTFKITTDEVGKILSSSGPPLSWYLGSLIISIGLIITVVGFALVTWKSKKIHNPQIN